MNEYALIDQKRWLRRTLSRSRMRRLDHRRIPAGRGEIRLFAVLRDEILRLPWFLDYYFNRLGIDRMFVVDNDSSDGSRELLLSTDRVHVFHTRETYTRQEAWVDSLLRRFGTQGWSVVIDVDEMLVYPHMKDLDLQGLVRYLDNFGFNAVHAFQLDMYSEGPLKDAVYRQGLDPLQVTPCFDADSFGTLNYPYRQCDPSPGIRFVGGMRQRMFGLGDVCLSKFPLLKFGPGLFLRQGTHCVEGAAVADIQAAELHFKFFSDFAPRTSFEAERGEHWNNASQYKAYAQATGKDPALNFSYPGTVRYAGESQLLKLGILRSSESFERFVGSPL